MSYKWYAFKCWLFGHKHSCCTEWRKCCKKCVEVGRIKDNQQNCCIKKLAGEIKELSNWVNEYTEVLPEEDRIKMADAGEYLRILSILINKSTPEILNEIQI